MIDGAQVSAASRKDPVTHVCMFCLTMAEASLGPSIKFVSGWRFAGRQEQSRSRFDSVVLRRINLSSFGKGEHGVAN